MNAPASSRVGEKKRLAHFFLREIHKDSALLPPDRWVIRTAINMVKTHHGLRHALRQAALFSGLGLLAVATGVAAIVTAPAVFTAAVCAGIASTATVLSLHQLKQSFKRLRMIARTDIKDVFAAKYLEMKVEEMKTAFRARGALGKAFTKNGTASGSRPAGAPPSGTVPAPTI